MIRGAALVKGPGMEYPPVGGQTGSTLLMVLAALVILGLTAGTAGNSWKHILQRDREQELLFRGDQYRRAIESFHHAWGIYPKQVDELLADQRALKVRRHLRRPYADPMTGRPFELIRDTTGAILGVVSTDHGRPFRRDGFPAGYEEFSRASSYRDWKFVFESVQKAETTGGAVGSPGESRGP
jgi:type II secretory pathway pseudopilin PulG